MDKQRAGAFIQEVDKQAYNGVMRLDKQLKDLLTQVETEIVELSQGSNGSVSSQNQEQLKTLSHEVKNSLLKITQLVNSALGDPVSVEPFKVKRSVSLDDLH